MILTRASIAALFGSASLTLSVAPHGVPAQDAHPSLAGTWQLDQARSEKYNPQVDRDLSRSDASGSSVKFGGNQPRGGSSRSTGDDASGPSTAGGGLDKRTSDAFREATKQPQTLHIEQTDSTVTISGAARPLTVFTNGQVVADSTLDGQITYAMKAQYKKDQLVIERQMGGGTLIRSTYYLDKKVPRTLIVDVRFESKAMSRTIENRRYYTLGA